MSAPMFSTVTASRPVRRTSRTTLVASILSHVLAIAVLLVVSILQPDTLPVPHNPLEVFVEAAALPSMPVDMKVPRQVIVSSDPASVGIPIVAPEGIGEESGLVSEPARDLQPVAGGMVDGVGGLSTLGEAPPPPPPPPPAAPVRIGGAIRSPAKIVGGPPAYPPLAQAARVAGVVILEATIGEDGRVRDVRVLRSIPLLDQAAVDAVRQWQYTPTLLNGVPVPVVMTVTVAFHLQ